MESSEEIYRLNGSTEAEESVPHRNEMPKGSTQEYRMINGDLMKRKRLQPTKPSWALAFLADLLMVSRVLWIGS